MPVTPSGAKTRPRPRRTAHNESPGLSHISVYFVIDHHIMRFRSENQSENGSLGIQLRSNLGKRSIPRLAAPGSPAFSATSKDAIRLPVTLSVGCLPSEETSRCTQDGTRTPRCPQEHSLPRPC